jgi:hypothetical protein
MTSLSRPLKENLADADKVVVEASTNNPIRLTEGQTELLTKALAEAAEQGAKSKSTETQAIRKPLAKPAPPAGRPAKKSMVV